MNNKSERGFSIIEALIVATIFLVFIAGVMGIFMRQTTKANLALEKNKVEENKETLGSLIRPDFENAGYGISDYSNQTYGKAEAIFPASADYYTTPGNLTRTGQGQSPIVSTMKIGSQTGSVTVKFNKNSYIYLAGETSGVFYLQVNGNDNQGYKLYATVNGETTEIGTHSPGATYRAALTPDAEGEAVAVIKIGEDGKDKQLVRKKLNDFKGAVWVGAFIENANDTLSIQMTGAPLIRTEKSRTVTPTLMMDADTQSLVPSEVYLNPADYSTTILSADRKTDFAYVQSPINSLENPITITTSKLDKGVMNTSDYCLLIDYTRGSSALVQITGITRDTSAQTVSLKPVTNQNKAWARFYSVPASLQGSYAQGSRLVKLAEPISYRFTGDSRLVREVGGRAENVAFDVYGFAVTSQQTESGLTYQIEIRIAADKRIADRNGIIPVLDYVYTATPRALNAANQKE